MLNKATWITAQRVAPNNGGGYVPGLVVAAASRGLGVVHIANQAAQTPPVGLTTNEALQSVVPGTVYGYAPELFHAYSSTHLFGM